MLKTSLLLISVGAVGASMIGTHFRSAPQNDANHKSSQLQVSAGNANSLVVKIPLGNVTLIADSSKDMSVHVMRSTKGLADAESRRWMNDSYLTAENHNGVLTVRDRPFGADSLDNIHSDNNNHSGKNGRSLDLEVVIHVPSQLAAKLNVTAGEANIRGQFRSINAEVKAGTLTTSGVRTTGNAELNVGAGSLNASLDGRSHGTACLRMGAGEVKLTIPAGAGTDVSADVSMGEIVGLPASQRKVEGMHLGDRRHGRTGSGDTKVDIHVGAGSIKVQSNDQVEASALLDEKPVKAMDLSDDEDIAQLGDIDGDISSKVKDALAKAEVGLDSAHGDMKFDLNDLKIDQSQDLGDLDKDLSKSLKDLGPMIEMAMKSAQKDSDQSLKSVQPEIEKAMKMAQIEIDKAMKQIGPEIEKAMRQARPEIERAMKQIKPEIEKAMKQIKPEIEKAMKESKPQMEKEIREAIKEMQRALKEMENSDKKHGE